MNEPKKKSTISRRTVFGGVGAAGALAAVAAVLPKAEPVQEHSAAPSVAEQDADGYRLTAHIQRYYQTARV
ncbi:MAG: twin-arginine translocation signal domain-containing protein [Ideonella sp.]|nr:twin-arginine translocation signal domain-containing protein [Ideonella sp.]